MSSVLSPNIFQAYCAVAVAFELPVIVQLLRGEWKLSDAGSWFDDEPYYNNNPALMYVYTALLAVLVVARAMAFVLPKARVIMVYNIVLNVVEVALFVYCFSSKEEEPSLAGYAIGFLMVANVAVFAVRLVFLKGQEKLVEMEKLKWRQEQLAIIRQKRADYAKQKLEKKEN